MEKFFSPCETNEAFQKDAEQQRRKRLVEIAKLKNLGHSFSPEQQDVIKTVLYDRENVFFTGSAGVGKSFLIQLLRSAISRNLFVTASTGIAAFNIGGMTIHSWAGVGLAKGPAQSLASNIKKNKDTLRRWKDCKVLVIDEISMVDGRLFAKLEHVARIVRRSSAPFGGIQLILCGDFFQLPPISKAGEPDVVFAFESEAWRRCINVTIELTTVFRQKQQVFVQLLNSIRIGVVSQEQIDVLRSRLITREQYQKGFNNGIIPTFVFPYKKNVHETNTKYLESLPGKKYVFEAIDTGLNQTVLEKTVPCLPIVTLAVGAQVMLLRNLDPDRGLVNGARGVVVGFSTDKARSGFPCVRPNVRFNNGEERIIRPEQWKIEKGGSVEASRIQLPLGLAWAISCHKCQGMTLDCVAIDLGSAFETGQAYVALSRVTSLEGLWITRFDPRVIRAHPKVMHFYKRLTRSRMAAAAKRKLNNEEVEFPTLDSFPTLEELCPTKDDAAQDDEDEKEEEDDEDEEEDEEEDGAKTKGDECPAASGAAGEVKSWGREEIVGWLRDCELEGIAPVLWKEQITTGRILLALESADLRDLDLPVGPRSLLKHELKLLKQRSGGGAVSLQGSASATQQQARPRDDVSAPVPYSPKLAHRSASALGVPSPHPEEHRSTPARPPRRRGREYAAPSPHPQVLRERPRSTCPPGGGQARQRDDSDPEDRASVLIDSSPFNVRMDTDAPPCPSEFTRSAVETPQQYPPPENALQCSPPASPCAERIPALATTALCSEVAPSTAPILPSTLAPEESAPCPPGDAPTNAVLDTAHAEASNTSVEESSACVAQVRAAERERRERLAKVNRLRRVARLQRSNNARVAPGSSNPADVQRVPDQSARLEAPPVVEARCQPTPSSTATGHAHHDGGGEASAAPPHPGDSSPPCTPPRAPVPPPHQPAAVPAAPSPLPLEAARLQRLARVRELRAQKDAQAKAVSPAAAPTPPSPELRPPPTAAASAGKLQSAPSPAASSTELQSAPSPALLAKLQRLAKVRALKHKQRPQRANAASHEASPASSVCTPGGVPQSAAVLPVSASASRRSAACLAEPPIARELSAEFKQFHVVPEGADGRVPSSPNALKQKRIRMALAKKQKALRAQQALAQAAGKTPGKRMREDGLEEGEPSPKRQALCPKVVDALGL